MERQQYCQGFPNKKSSSSHVVLQTVTDSQMGMCTWPQEKGFRALDVAYDIRIEMRLSIYCGLVEAIPCFLRVVFNERWVALMLPSHTLWVKAVLGAIHFHLQKYFVRNPVKNNTAFGRIQFDSSVPDFFHLDTLHQLGYSL